MLILRDPALASSIADPEIRALVEQRFAEICAGELYDYDLHGYMIVVQPSDTVEALEEESSCPILHNRFDNARYGDPDFSPSFDILEDHDGCFEMLFITNDDGFGITLFIPKAEGIAADLLAMCKEFSSPAMTPV
jgi:hypothetical protein